MIEQQQHSDNYILSIYAQAEETTTTATTKTLSDTRFEDLKPREAPECLLAICPEAEILWPKLFRRADLMMLYNFGISDLMFRLECQLERERRRGVGADYRQRARAWYHVAAASVLGKSDIPELTEAGIAEWTPLPSAIGTSVMEVGARTHAVNCFTCGKRFRQREDSRFTSCRNCRGLKSKQKSVERKAARAGELPDGWRRCSACGGVFEPARSDAQFCKDKACQDKRAANRKQDSRKPEKPAAVTPVESYTSPEDI